MRIENKTFMTEKELHNVFFVSWFILQTSKIRRVTHPRNRVSIGLFGFRIWFLQVDVLSCFTRYALPMVASHPDDLASWKNLNFYAHVQCESSNIGLLYKLWYILDTWISILHACFSYVVSYILSISKYLKGVSEPRRWGIHQNGSLAKVRKCLWWFIWLF